MPIEGPRPTETGGAGGAGRLVARLGLPIDPELLVLALTHRSFAYEAGGLPTNERLEFLGDSVLGLVVTERLYRSHPELAEGELAKMRAATVSQRALAALGRELGVGDFILLGKGERTTGGRDKASILSDTVEALIGAVYLCHGLEPTRRLVERLLESTLDRAATAGAGLDWKTSLQEAAARHGLGAPVYEVVGNGPDHARVFTARVVLAGTVRGVGVGAAKKVAEQIAAAAAYDAILSGSEAGSDSGLEAHSEAGSGSHPLAHSRSEPEVDGDGGPRPPGVRRSGALSDWLPGARPLGVSDASRGA